MVVVFKQRHYEFIDLIFLVNSIITICYII